MAEHNVYDMPVLIGFATLIDRLAKLYGEPAPLPVTEPFAMILWENVAYLANDAKRAEAFDELRTKVGLTPAAIRQAKDAVLLSIASKGIVPAGTVDKLRAASAIARDSFHDDLAPILDKPLPAAKKDLRKFPAIGEPAAEKILLFNQRFPILAMDSNALRVLVRIGYAPEHRNYSTTYKNMQRFYGSTDRNCANATRRYAINVHCGPIARISGKSLPLSCRARLRVRTGNQNPADTYGPSSRRTDRIADRRYSSAPAAD